MSAADPRPERRPRGAGRFDGSADPALREFQGAPADTLAAKPEAEG